MMQTVCRCGEMMYGCWKSRDSSYVTEKGVSKCVQWVGTLILKGVYMCFFVVGLNPLKVKLDLTFTGMDGFSFILQSLASFLSNFPSIIYINVKECRSIPAWERRRQALCLMVSVSGEWAKHGVDSGGKTSLDNSCICDALALRWEWVRRLRAREFILVLFGPAQNWMRQREDVTCETHWTQELEILFSYFVILTINNNYSEYLWISDAAKRVIKFCSKYLMTLGWSKILRMSFFFTHDCVYTTLKNHNKTRCVSTTCHVTLVSRWRHGHDEEHS